MRFTRTDVGARTVLRIQGALDVETVADVRATMDAIADEGRRDVVLDFSGLHRIDSSGVGIVVALFKRVQQYGGSLRIEGLRDQPRCVFEMLRLHRLVAA
jgi:anti-sigma B factor antagonist